MINILKIYQDSLVTGFLVLWDIPLLPKKLHEILPSEWGNPFSHKEGTLAKFKCNSVEESVLKYEEWIKSQPQLLVKISQLKGKVLACWCKTKKNPHALCHGDILAKLADNS